MENLWKVFNEYLLECFLVFGRTAINIFLPFKKDELTEDDKILSETYRKLNSEKLISIFKRIIVEYPEKLNTVELRYLTLLSSRAERFYSLGILKEDYEKIQNLQFKDLIVLLDTNTLYSVLQLHTHPETSAIAELIRISKEKLIELRLAYLPATYSELQNARNHLERLIPKEKYKISHIKALINSGKLGSFTRQYYETKLENSELAHPADKVQYAKELLESKGVIIYNDRFHHFDDDFINEKIEEYFQFQRNRNFYFDANGIDIHLKKDPKKIEHDVFLREAIKELKSKYTNETELRFICVTLDKRLIEFDQFARQNKSSSGSNIINPNFIYPSVFIKKIRPFLPIVTNDYRKAFLSSLTAPSLDKEDDKNTILVQQSMSYFKKLGIDDEKIILDCMKRDLFFEEFSQIETVKESEKFIESEVARESHKLKEEKELLEITLQSERDKQKREAEKTKEEKLELKSEISERDSEISKLESRLLTVENQNNFDREISEWETKKGNYVEEKWDEQIHILNTNRSYCIGVFSLTIVPIIIAIILNVIPFLKDWINTLGYWQWLIWGSLATVTLSELFGRSYIHDKDRIKEGYYWLKTAFSHKTHEQIKKEKKIQFEEKFLIEHPKPKEDNLLETKAH